MTSSSLLGLSPRRALIFAIILLSALSVGTQPVPVTARGFDAAIFAARAEEFRASMGLSPSAAAFAEASASPTAIDKWGVALTAAEEADLNDRAAKQEQLEGVEAIVLANPRTLGGMWLDQRAGGGHGFVLVIAFKDEVSEPLMTLAVKAAPAGVAVRPTVVARSMSELEAIADQANALALSLPAGAVVAVQLEPQNNQVVVETRDGVMPVGLAPTPGLVVKVGDVQPAAWEYCDPDDRCYLRYFRGGEQILNKSGPADWHQCTSGYYARRNSDSKIVMLTSAHCQVNYYNSFVYGKDSTEKLGIWGPDTIPTNSITCLTVCDVTTEVQQITNLTSVPSTRNTVYYDVSNKAYTIQGLRTYGSTWVGTTVCKAGAFWSLQCGTVTSIGSEYVPMSKENYTARVAKSARSDGLVHEGDSGGPVVSNHIAYGFAMAIHTGLGEGWGRMSFDAVGPALSEMNLSLCVAASC